MTLLELFSRKNLSTMDLAKMAQANGQDVTEADIYNRLHREREQLRREWFAGRDMDAGRKNV